MVANRPFVRTKKKPSDPEGILRDEKVYLVDAPIFGGNSGGQIFLFPVLGSKTTLAGLISASNPAGNFAVAEPASRIAEAIEAAFPAQRDVSASWHLLNQ